MGEEQPRFPGGCTVLMPVYAGDNAPLFARALDSVYANTLRPDHVLVVADGPLSDEIDDVIGSYEGRVDFSVHRIPCNQGLHTALNTGLELVRTAWVLRADADDYNLPDRFNRQAMALAQEPGVVLIGGAIHEFERDGDFVASRRPPTSHAEICDHVKRRNPFNHMTVAFRLDAVKAVGGYPAIPLKEDYALWASLIASGSTGINLNDVLVHATAGREMYRRRGGWRYALSEIQLQRHLYRTGLVGLGAACAMGVLRSLVFLMPNAARGYLYRTFLRSKD